jgi:hypothetical protein
MNQEWLIGLIGGVQVILLFVFKKIFENVVKSKFDKSLESIKTGFTKDVEKLKSDLALNVNSEVAKLQALLSKGNIGFQIHTAEYTKYQFDKVVKMYISVIEVAKLRLNAFHVIFGRSDEEVEAQMTILKNSGRKVEDQLTETSLFISPNLEKSVQQFLTDEFLVLHYMENWGKMQNRYNEISAGNWNYDFAENPQISDEQLNLEYEAAKQQAFDEAQHFSLQYGLTVNNYNDTLAKLKKEFKAELSGIENQS